MSHPFYIQYDSTPSMGLRVGLRLLEVKAGNSLRSMLQSIGGKQGIRHAGKEVLQQTTGLVLK